MSSLKGLAIIAGLVLLPSMAFAQASITGVVKDASGAVLPGVTVEASSDALIERVRSAITDGTGQYRIVDLRPGTYAVTFTLTGFSSFKREGIELTGAFTATINADLKVGTVEETVTVSGATPVVDVQSVRRQTTVTSEVYNSIPSAKSYAGLMLLIPAVSMSSGTSADIQMVPGMVVFGGSGGRTNEGRLQVDGLNTGAVLNGAGVSPYVADMQNSQEVTFTTSGGLGEEQTGGPALNVVPRTGGNAVKGSIYLAGVSSGMVGDNYSQALKDAGLSVPGTLLKLWDVNGGLGGPIRKDRLWYFLNVRDEGSFRSVPGMYANLNVGDPTKWTYVPDLTRQAQTAGSWTIANLRLTTQVTARNKINLFWDEQMACSGAPWSSSVTGGCRDQVSSGAIIAGGSAAAGIGATTTATSAPETASYTGPRTTQRVQQLTWQSPATSRLLLEAGVGTFLNRWGGQEIPGNPTRDIVRIVEQCTAGCANNGNIANLTYRSQNWADHWMGTHTWRASASYVTGAQNIKVGYQGGLLVDDQRSVTNTENLQFRFNNGVPNQITENLLPIPVSQRARYDAVYAQEQWTRGRLTLQGSVRFDLARSYFPQAQVGPTRFLTTPIVFAEATGVDSYKDVSPRGGLAYDVFGNGKTSVKVNIGRYLEAAQNGGNYSGPRPTGRITTTVTRTWTDANRNFVPDCVLTNPLGNNECAQISDLNFGTDKFSNTFDPGALTGWGVRASDWQFGASVQHEFLPRVSVEAGYYRRWLQGFFVTDNLSRAPNDFGTFSITSPLDPRLPGGGGNVIAGLYDPNQNVASLVNNYITRASNYGDQSQTYNGLLINLTARPRSGVSFQGGINSGSTVTDNCAVRAQLPEINPVNPFCRTGSGFVTRVTGLGSFTIPKIDVQIGATFRSDQGGALAANYVVTNAAVVPSLGRSLSNNAPNVTVNLIEPGTVYGDRVNALDLRFVKIVKLGRTRTNVGFEFYNVTNSAAVLTYNQAFIPGGAWLTPTSVLQPRYGKITAQIDF
jgi:Carboxypeptidase regulatory-like domain